MESFADQFIGLLPRYAGGRAPGCDAAGEGLYSRLADESVAVFEVHGDGTLGKGGESACPAVVPGIWCDGAPLGSVGAGTEELLRGFHDRLVPHGVLFVGIRQDATVEPLLDRVGFDLAGRFPGAGGVEYLLGTKRAGCCSGARRVLYDRSGFLD
ncbi:MULTISPECIES: hypothetical protein [unclassified Kitasatospora]|uniref:hypothetical protein n=1 Tax=unclassified Kitasatospora TaxID=2633591 RepID=UPI0033C4B382